MKNTRSFLLFISLVVLYTPIFGQKNKTKNNTEEIKNIVKGLQFRSIGPAFSSGRIADFAVNPDNPSEYYVAVAMGHVWKTTNNGITFKPVFENYGAYSIGCVEMDPNNHNIIWVGTGENNHQRAIGYVMVYISLWMEVRHGKIWDLKIPDKLE